MMGLDSLRYERAARARGWTVIAGMDEAGRGPLAGPVVAACVILPEAFDCTGIDDSKKLTEKRREAAYTRIVAEAAAWAVGIAASDVIDQINILQATHAAMRDALAAVTPSPDILLVDGLPVPSLVCARQKAIVKGDSASVSIAAASIIAKVTRDRMMREYALQYPEYGFDGHKGYGSSSHLAALERHGPCPIHRRSFAPVARLVPLISPP
jgi:ribonuclease HII